jgi:outer membrane receptor protein involved in Fe transport
MSKRKTITPGEYAGAFTVANLTFLSQDLVNSLTFSVSVYNIFNDKYWDPGAELEAIQQNGRNFRLKITYAF